MSRMHRIVLTGFSLTLLAATGFSQNQSQPKPQNPPAPAVAAPPAASTPAANPSDVSSPDAIIAAVYNVISGPAGQKRDWDRMNSLFYPGARLIHTATKKEGGGLSVVSLSVQDYIDHASKFFETNGFSEREIARHTEKWANIYHAFSTYESRHDAKDPAPFARGINSFQLFFDGTRWWIITIYWQQESLQNPLTPEFLPPSH
jgi:hypothetical protein